MKKLVNQSDFPATRDCAYLNTASIGLMPKVAGETLIDWNRELAEHGTKNFDEEAEEKVFKDLHHTAAQLYGAREDDIAVASSATEFLCSLAWAIYPEKGTNIVSTDIEHPTVTYPWIRVSRHTGTEIRMAKGRRGAVEPEDVIKLIDDRTSVLFISHVEYGSGQCFDIAELSDIAHQHGALFIVDASQSSGAIPIDVKAWEIDSLVSTGYKWLCGPFGAAILYLNPKLSHLVPGLVGWRSTKDIWNFVADTIDYPTEARRFEFSTMNYGSAVALARAIKYLLDVGIERIFAHNIALADLLIEGLEDLGGKVSPYPGGLPSSIVNVQFPDRNQDHIAARLNAAGVIVSSRMGGIRISPHLYNTEEDIRLALEALEGLLANY